MSKLFFEIIATIKGNVPRETLTPPDFVINEATAESIEIEIIRRDSRGEVLRWEIAGDENFQQDVVGLNERSGTLLDSGTVVLTNNGTPINNFYLRVRDTNRPNYNDGIQAIQFVRINETEVLAEPQFALTPLIDSVLINLTPVNNATRYILEQSLNGVDWDEVTDDYPIGSQPYEVTGLDEETVYFFRITATSDSLLFRDSFAIRETETLDIPTLPVPTDLSFEDLGSGVVRVGTVYSGVSGVTYVVERNGVEVYSGLSATFDLSGFVDATAYTIRTKVELVGYDESDWYSETYTHQDTPTDYLTLEQFGGNPYYKRFDGELNYTSLGNGTTRITYTGTSDVFDGDDVGKSFCGLYANKNPQSANPSNVNEYFPGTESSRYCTVVAVENGKNIIVNFQFNLNKTDWYGYIFFDNSKAFSDAIDSLINTDSEELRLVADEIYIVPQYVEKVIPDKPITIQAISGRAGVKIGYEDYHNWGLPTAPRLVKQAGNIFRLVNGSSNFISHNINWLPPHRVVIEKSAPNRSLFGGSGDTIGLNNRSIVISNCDMTAEKVEVVDTPANFPSFGVGFLYAGGLYSGTGINEDTSDFMNLILSNFVHDGMTALELKANNGGGLRLVGENSSIKSTGEFVRTWLPVTVKFTNNRTGLAPDIVSRSYYPSHVLEITSDNSFFQVQDFYTASGWGNGGNVIQIGGFVFWQPSGYFWQATYEYWYNRGNIKRNWIISDSGSEHFTATKMMVHSIPLTGQTYTIGRSYMLNGATNQPPTSVTNYNSRVRGNLNWSLILNKRWDLIDPVTEIPANAQPIEFQPGDRFTIVGQGPTVYKVIRTDRTEWNYGDYSNEIHRFGNGTSLVPSLYASEYWLDQELPSGLGLSFEITMVESKAQVLLDGVERPAYIASKGNVFLRAADVFGFWDAKNHDENTTMEHGNIVATQVAAMHAAYNHEQITAWLKNFVSEGYYRESHNGTFGTYSVLNPATGQQVQVSALRKYSKGYTLINCSGMANEFSPHEQFELRDLIRKSQGINLSEDLKEKLRMYACTDMGNMQTIVNPYVERYPDDTGAPDMPTVCRNLLNSLP